MTYQESDEDNDLRHRAQAFIHACNESGAGRMPDAERVVYARAYFKAVAPDRIIHLLDDRNAAEVAGFMVSAELEQARLRIDQLENAVIRALAGGDHGLAGLRQALDRKDVL